MSNTQNILHINENNTLQFGDYTLTHKTKVEDVEFEGDLYKVKTFKEITKLEQNDLFLYESVPGSRVDQFRFSLEEVSFVVSASSDIQIILEVAADSSYEVFVDDESLGVMKTNFTGKLTLSLEMIENQAKSVLLRMI